MITSFFNAGDGGNEHGVARLKRGINRLKLGQFANDLFRTLSDLGLDRLMTEGDATYALLKKFENAATPGGDSKALFDQSLPEMDAPSVMSTALLRRAREYSEFVKWVRDEGYVGADGKARFGQSVNHVTQMLQVP